MPKKKLDSLQKLVFVDTETTGLNPIIDRVIEVGLIRIEKGQIVSKYETVVNPTIEVPDFCIKMTGIKKKEFKKAPTFKDIKDKFFDEMKDALFIAHNAKFDFDFLDNEFIRVDLPFGPASLCTVKLSRILFPHFPRHDLDTITRRLHIDVSKRHRAFDDALALWELFQILQKRFSQEKLEHVISGLITPPRRIFKSTAKSQMGMLI